MAVIKKGRKTNNRVLPTEGSKPLEPQALLAFARENGIETSPLDISDLARSYGIRVTLQPMHDDTSGHLSLQDGAWNICINSLHHWKRQRFTLAHELGHYFLHRWHCQNFVDKMLFRNNETSPMEAEANRFAADLLMPESEFRNFINNKSAKVEHLAEHFAVSALAIRVRAKTLGYHGHGL